MAIETSQIHNLVRTYQRTLHEEKATSKPTNAAPHHEDRVTVSAEARERHTHKTDEQAHTHSEKPRKP